MILSRTTMVLAGALALVVGCGRTPPPAKHYQLTGQVLSLTPERTQMVVKHDDIKDFMPAMTMSYTVRDAGGLTGKKPGDLISAILTVEEVDAYLTDVKVLGHAPLDAAPTMALAHVLERGETASDVPLIDHDGRPVVLSALRGHRVALTFIYTRCPLPNFCPLMDRHFSTVQKTVANTPSLADVRLVSVTLDPAFDTPAVLQAHARRLGADTTRWTFLTGQPDDVTRFAGQFGIHTEPDPKDANVVVHNLRTAVLDAEGRVSVIRSDNTWTPSQLIADLKNAPARAR